MKVFGTLLTLVVLASSAFAQSTYVGSAACKTCHAAAHDAWKLSGHPYKIQKLQGGNGPVYPVLSSQKSVGSVVSYTLQSGIPTAPDSLPWNKVGFVLGGYHSNARFLDTAGYLIYGNNRQYNLPTKKWVAYTSGSATKGSYTYSCYRCHTTGASKVKTAEFQAYPGIEGSWAEAGIGCEGCHGPASAHAASPSSVKPPKEGNATCSHCHARDRNDSISTYPWNNRVEWQPRTVNSVSTGFIRHREQGDMMAASKHKNLACVTCHDPHKGVYFDQGGLKASVNCQTCHTGKEIAGHESSKTKAECTDCHMPKAARNGDQLTAYVSEQSAHYWKVITDSITMFQNLDDINSTANPPVTYKFIKTDGNGMSGLTLDYTCKQCHTDKSVAWASKYAKGMHAGITTVKGSGTAPAAYALGQNYPNPFNPSTAIRYAIPRASHVTLKVYSMTGALVATVVNAQQDAGWHDVTFSAGTLSSGIYIYRLTAGDFSYSRKMMLLK